MGDHPHILPVSDAVKHVGDSVTISGTAVGLLGWIQWPTIAAILASIYTAIRICETETAGRIWKALKARFNK